VKFWDASAIVPLLIAEASTRRLQALAAGDPDMLVWWGSQVECASALARLERDAALDPQAAVLAFDRLKQFAAGWHEVDPSDVVRETAVRFFGYTRSGPPMRCSSRQPSLPRNNVQPRWK
jgi:predicted nucleic acid-binding protein